MKNNKQGKVISFGNFDGVHLGHNHLIKRMKALTKNNNTAIITFDPHPKRFFHPDIDGFYLTTIEQKISLLKDHGINEIHVIPFTKEFASLSAEYFIEHFLVKKYNAQHIVVGENCVFGNKKTGNISSLQTLSTEYAYEILPLAENKVDGITCSSSQIRKYLQAGEIKIANQLLGRPYEITGEVIRGQQRRIGFPTINLSLHDYIIPKLGVYAATTQIYGHTYHGVVNIGNRPTFNGENIILEMHVLNFNLDVYGELLAVKLLEFIRPEQKFDSIEALKNQIQQDIQFVKNNCNN